MTTLISCVAARADKHVVNVRNDQDAYHVTINLNNDDHPQRIEGQPLHVDSTTRKVISKFKYVLTKQDEKKIAQKYITFAENVKKLYDSIPEDASPDASALKQQLLAIVRDFTLKSEHPGVDMLKSTLNDFKKVASSQQVQNNNNEGGAQTLGLPAAIKAVSFAMNVADKIGTYSDSLSKASKFLEGPVANKLQKLKPFEEKIARKIAPVVKSKTFQTARRSLEVVSAALSLKGGLKALGMVKKIKLGTLKNVRKTLKELTKVVKNSKQIMKMIRKNPLKALKRFKKFQKQ
ncbi:hypothetical protein FDP41_010274 [Naegleria fowleri]|uniref:Uncharacterized protein n=1 Tax=Naegleria fowleri TaxID=5763 RepID=A0A6A5CD28_NAEFO|nr:uncharacterized protein FDP41_010274 [Naegleria fowleri]KAF0983209.1 hypothetical protein FDP41_010274 [Naegleria fowleri]